MICLHAFQIKAINLLLIVQRRKQRHVANVHKTLKARHLLVVLRVDLLNV